jgi:hypothetical protein
MHGERAAAGDLFPVRASADLEVTAKISVERLKRGEVPHGRSAGVRCQAVSKSGGAMLPVRLMTLVNSLRAADARTGVLPGGSD